MALSGVEGFTLDVVDVDDSTASRSGIKLREDSSLIFRGASNESLIDFLTTFRSCWVLSVPLKTWIRSTYKEAGG